MSTRETMKKIKVSKMETRTGNARLINSLLKVKMVFISKAMLPLLL